MLGRVLAAARLVGESTVPLAYVLAGPIADGIFEPLMRPTARWPPPWGR